MTGEPASHHYLIQKLSVAVQRGNAAAILGSMGGLATLEENFFGGSMGGLATLEENFFFHN